MYDKSRFVVRISERDVERSAGGIFLVSSTNQGLLVMTKPSDFIERVEFDERKCDQAGGFCTGYRRVKESCISP